MSFEDYEKWARKQLKARIIEEAWDWKYLHDQECFENQRLIADYNNLAERYNNLLEENGQFREELDLKAADYNRLLSRARQQWEAIEEAKFYERGTYSEQREEFDYSSDNSTRKSDFNYIQQLESEIEFLKSEIQETKSFFGAMLNLEQEIDISKEPYMPGFPLRIPDFFLEGKSVFVIGATGKYFHRPGCRYLCKVNVADCNYFEFKKDAIKSGYEPCEVCCL